MKFGKCWLLLIFGWGVGCSIGPSYQRPMVEIPEDWRWKKAEPGDQIPKGKWWTVFGDSTLDRLEEKAMEANQTLKGAVAQVDLARARSRQTLSHFFPEITLDAQAVRSRTSANTPVPFPSKLPSVTQNSFRVPLDLSYELDLWGRVRRSFESARAQAEAFVADYQNILLSLQSEVAMSYFSLRTLDRELELLKRACNAYEATVHLLKVRLQAGLISELDLTRAEAEFASVQTEQSDIQRQRAEMECVLSLLLGQPASTFKLEPGLLDEKRIPEIPPDLPSRLLERRPDVARAERMLEARNAEIGIAYAAFFPSVRLTGSGGYLSMDTRNLFDWESRTWTLGPSVDLPIFAGGRNIAELKAARSAYEKSITEYRQEILIAFKDVEESLAQVHFRKEQNESHHQAVVACRRSWDLTQDLYQNGNVSYLEVIESERNLLNAERQQSRLIGSQWIAQIRLIKALGGGWAVGSCEN